MAALTDRKAFWVLDYSALLEMAYEWLSPNPMPSKRVFSTPVDVEEQLYVLGGCDVKGKPLGNLECYNPSTNTWTKLQDMTTKRAGTCALVVDKKIVALGGISTSQQPLDSVEIFDCVKKCWSTGDSLPEKLLGLSGIVRGNKVLVVGGMGTDTNPKDYLLEYDLNSNKWKRLPPMPTPRYATFAFIVNDKLYVIGGRQGKIPVKVLEMYDFSTNKWTKLPDVPSSRVFAVYVQCGQYIYSLGGLMADPKQGFSDVTEIFDIEKEKWTVGSAMLSRRGDFAAGGLGDNVVVAGGLGNQGVPLKSAEVYDVVSDTWTNIEDLPSAHCSCAFIIFQHKLHVIGGLSVSGPTGSIASLSVKN